MTKEDWWEDSIFIRMKEGIREEWAKKFHNSIFKYDDDESKYLSSHSGEPIPHDEEQFYATLPSLKKVTPLKSSFNEQEKKELEYFLGEDAKLLFGEDTVIVTNDLE